MLKKRMIGFFLVTLLIVALGACTNGTAPQENEEARTPDETVEQPIEDVESDEIVEPPMGYLDSDEFRIDDEIVSDEAIVDNPIVDALWPQVDGFWSTDDVLFERNYFMFLSRSEANGEAIYYSGWFEAGAGVTAFVTDIEASGANRYTIAFHVPAMPDEYNAAGHEWEEYRFEITFDISDIDAGILLVGDPAGDMFIFNHIGSTFEEAFERYAASN